MSFSLKGIHIKRPLEDDSSVVKQNKCRKLDFNSVGDPTPGRSVVGKLQKERKRNFRSVKKYLRLCGSDEKPNMPSNMSLSSEIDFPDSWLRVDSDQDMEHDSSLSDNAGGWMGPTTGSP